ETWMNAHKAIELGFADGILGDEKRQASTNTMSFSRRAVTNSLLDKMQPAQNGIPAESLEKRLSLILH
ncbi:MAG: Clp protease ClpP, partial [Oscillospiraceae bacterium]|nr:Clp protease ClpP [Oscillospiraceae bacterium]